MIVKTVESVGLTEMLWRDKTCPPDITLVVIKC